jgi:hypothetical protein
MRNDIAAMTDSHKQLMMAYKNLFEGESADKVLNDLRDYCRWDQPVFIKPEHGMSDPIELGFLDGRRDVIHYILRNIKKDLPKG